MQQKICKYCGDIFSTCHDYKIACSKSECKEKYHHEKSYLKSVCPICNNEFEYRKSKPKEFCSKKCAQSSPKTKEKMVQSQKETYREKYGADHPMQTKKTKENFRNAMVEKYGVEHALQSKEILKKQKETIQERYGVGNVFESAGVQEKSKNTLIRKYGVENYTKTKDFKNRLYKNTYDKILHSNKFFSVAPKFELDEFEGTQEKKYEFECKDCGHIFMAWIRNGLSPNCPNCRSNQSMTIGHQEIYNFVKSILPNEEIKINDRTILDNFAELDLYIPSKKLAIEFDGLYWHSEISGGKSKDYHMNKTLQCKKIGIKLIHVFDVEWIRKKDIVKSIIFGLVNKNATRIYARKCAIKEITAFQKNEFLIQNHLQGSDNSSVYYGLFNGNELVSAMTFSKSRFDKKYEWEICRFCNRKYTSVVGAASRLLKRFEKDIFPNNIVTYSDMRYFDGEVYKSIGFEEAGETRPNYWYINLKTYILSNRMNYQKHKLKTILKKFDENLSEWENMKLNGYDRIWDCGNKKFVIDLAQK